jgi:hypothetical protein
LSFLRCSPDPWEGCIHDSENDVTNDKIKALTNGTTAAQSRQIVRASQRL